MIIRTINLNVNDNKAVPSPKIVMYKGDSGLLLKIILKKFDFNISTLKMADATFINIDNPLNNCVFYNIAIHEDSVVMELVGSIVDIIGTGNIEAQLHLYDEYLNRISTPVFSLTIKDTIYDN